MPTKEQVCLEHATFGRCWIRGVLLSGSNQPMFEAKLTDGRWKLLSASPEYWRETPTRVTEVLVGLLKKARKRIAALQPPGNPNLLRRDVVVDSQDELPDVDMEEERDAMTGDDAVQRMDDDENQSEEMAEACYNN